jgi:hypothetical protein
MLAPPRISQGLGQPEGSALVFTTLIPGGISILVALLFLGVLAWRVPSIPLWIVILAGAVPMAVSLVQARREENG